MTSIINEIINNDVAIIIVIKSLVNIQLKNQKYFTEDDNKSTSVWYQGFDEILYYYVSFSMPGKWFAILIFQKENSNAALKWYD